MINKEILSNIGLVAFRFFKKEPQQKLLLTILKVMDIEVNFKDNYIEYKEDVDNKIRYKLEDLKKENPQYKYEVTPLYINEYDLETMESILEKHDDCAGSLYPLFYSIGYTLILKEGVWKIGKSNFNCKYSSIEY